MKRFMCLLVLVALVLTGCVLPSNKKRILTPAEEKALAVVLYDKATWFDLYIIESEAKAAIGLEKRNSGLVYTERFKVNDLLGEWLEAIKPATGEVEKASSDYLLSLIARVAEFQSLSLAVDSILEGDLRGLKNGADGLAKAKSDQDRAMELSGKAQEQLKKLANR